MENKLVLEIYRKHPFEKLTEELADPESRLNTGSSACAAGAVAFSLLNRAALLCRAALPEENERVEYIVRNSASLRAYLAFLVDEDVKCRGPLRKARKGGGPDEIAACCQPASAIAAEAVNMMQKLLELDEELICLFPGKLPHFVFEAASLAFSAAEAAVPYILSVARLSDDDTYRYVTEKENHVYLDLCRELKEKIYSRLEDLDCFEG